MVNNDIDEKINDDIKRIFEYIINSPNVKLYTYEDNIASILHYKYEIGSINQIFPFAGYKELYHRIEKYEKNTIRHY